MGRVHPYFSFSFCPIIFLCVTNLLHKKGQKRAPIVKRVQDFNVKNNSFPICLQSGADDLWTQTTLQNNDDDEKKPKKNKTKGNWFCSTKWVLKSLIESSKKKKQNQKKLMKNLRNNFRVEKGVDVGAHQVFQIFGSKCLLICWQNTRNGTNLLSAQTTF